MYQRRAHSKSQSTSPASVLQRNVGFLLSGALLIFSAHSTSAAELSGYDILDSLGSSSYAYSINGSGDVVVGSSFNSNGYERAVRWSSDGVTDLGTLGGIYSYAFDVSADGTVIVGSTPNGGVLTAFRWTEASAMTALSPLDPGYSAVAYGVSASGAKVAGFSESVGNAAHAVIWDVTAGSIQDLGTLGGAYSFARGISGDGTTAVGYSADAVGRTLAFRWTAAGNMVSLNTLGGNESYAIAVNNDGAVVVGHSRTASSQTHAFRWTEGTGMVDLQTLGGSYSEAMGVNADGTVVVGSSAPAGNGGPTPVRGFRWTEATGMVSIEDWLRNNGVTVVSDFTNSARAVSDDGNIIVGETVDGQAYIARVVGDGNSGVIDMSQYAETLAAKPSTQVSLNLAQTILNGAHGEPMRNLLDQGKQSFSITADTGYDNASSSDGGLGIGDLAYGIGLENGATARFAFGGLYTKQDIDTGGDFHQQGFYVAPEISLPVSGNLYATLGGLYAKSSIDIRRGYVNGGVMDYSDGDTDTSTWGAKLRLDWLNAATVNDWKFTPYTSLTYVSSQIDGYTETGGAFPSSFDASHDHATVARVGLDTVIDIGNAVRLIGKAEAAYQFENSSARTSGTIIGLSGFDLQGGDVDQFWVRGGIGAEFDAAGGTATISLNATTSGNDPTVWLRSGWKVEF